MNNFGDTSKEWVESPPPLVGIGFTDLPTIGGSGITFKFSIADGMKCYLKSLRIIVFSKFIKNIPKIQPSTSIVGSSLAQARISKLNPFKGLGFVRAANYIHQAAAAALGPQMKLPLLKNVDEYLLFRGSSLHRSSGTPFIILRVKIGSRVLFWTSIRGCDCGLD